MIRVIFDLPEHYQTPEDVTRVLIQYDRLLGEWIEAEASHNRVAMAEADERAKSLADDFLSDCMMSWRVEVVE